MAGERASSMSMTDDKPFMDVAAEMSDPKKIRRANHVESFDRGLKMATSIALMVAAITIGANLSESDAVSATIPVCGDVVDGAELLVPVSYESTQDMQSAGIAVCVGRP